MSEIKLHIENDRAFKERATKLARQIDQGQDRMSAEKTISASVASNSC